MKSDGRSQRKRGDGPPAPAADLVRDALVPPRGLLDEVCAVCRGVLYRTWWTRAIDAGLRANSGGFPHWLLDEVEKVRQARNKAIRRSKGLPDFQRPDRYLVWATARWLRDHDAPVPFVGFDTEKEDRGMVDLRMPDINRVELAGRTTRDIELRATKALDQMAAFSLAVETGRKGADGGWIKETAFVPCVVFGKTAEYLAANAPKGTAIVVEGRLRLDEWQDKAGETRQQLKVVINRAQLLQWTGDRPAKPAADDGAAPAPHDDGVPF